jgi:hypothetical protein
MRRAVDAGAEGDDFDRKRKAAEGADLLGAVGHHDHAP